MSNRIPALLAGLALAGSTLAGNAAAAEHGGLREFEARYAVNFRGLNAGTSQLTLRKLPEARWSYTSQSFPQGVFRLALPGELAQRSIFTLHEGNVRPLEFTSEIGTKSGDRDQTMHFNWEKGRVTGIAEGKPVDLPLEPGTMDAMSVQIAMMLKLLNGQSPDRFRMIDKTKIKEYVYTREGEEVVKTPLGEQRTVIYRSAREGATRGTLFWCAPALGYVPVKVERRNGTRVEWSLALQALERPAS